MRDFSPAFAARLAAGVTTFCMAWRVSRADGVILGFTDHDRALAFDGTTFEPQSGAEGSALASSADLAVDNAAIEGLLSSERLSDADLLGGRFDGAVVEVFRVDWTDPSARALLKRMTVGEIRREGARFVAELRGPAAALDRVVGRVYQRRCDAELGDARCGVDVDARARNGAVVAVLGEARFSVSGLESAAVDDFAGGRLRWTSGANAGLSAACVASTSDEIALRVAPGHAVAAGDAFRLYPGCDKSFATCRAVFANAVNFRGFPSMPGDDAALGYPLRGEPLDGGKR